MVNARPIYGSPTVHAKFIDKVEHGDAANRPHAATITISSVESEKAKRATSAKMRHTFKLNFKLNFPLESG